MALTTSTPLGALFSIMKRRAGISYKDLAACILSEKPLAGGVSPINRVNDRTWISRYLVHAPVESIKDDYFVSYEKCAMRIISRLKKRMDNREIMDMIAGQPGKAMTSALETCGQDTAPYRNMLDRLAKDAGLRGEERVEIAMVLFVAAALSASVSRATACALEFTDEIHGTSVETPLITPNSEESNGDELRRLVDEHGTLGLLRVVDGYVVGSPHWLDATRSDDVEVGAFATDAGSISDVAPDVSGHHARIWHEDGTWYVEGLGSKNGTVLVSGADKTETIVEPAAGEREGWTSQPVALQPGDELVFGKSTRYVVIAGVQ